MDIDCPCSAMLQVCPSPPSLVVGGGIKVPLPRVCGDLLFTTHALNTTHPHAYILRKEKKRKVERKSISNCIIGRLCLASYKSIDDKVGQLLRVTRA